MTEYTDVQRVIKYIRFLEERGYVVKEGRKTSKTRKKGGK